MDLRPLEAISRTYGRRQALLAHWQARLEPVRCYRDPVHLSMQDYLLLRLQPRLVKMLGQFFFPYEACDEPFEVDQLLARLAEPVARRCVVARQALERMQRQPPQAVEIYRGLSGLDRDQILHWCLQPMHQQLWLQLRSEVSSLSETDRLDLLEEAIATRNLEAVAWLQPLVRLNLRNVNLCYMLRQAVFESDHYPLVAQFGLELLRGSPQELEKATSVEFLVDYVNGFLREVVMVENPYHPLIVELIDRQLRLGRPQWLAYLLKTFPDFSLAEGIFLNHQPATDDYTPTASDQWPTSTTSYGRATLNWWH